MLSYTILPLCALLAGVAVAMTSQQIQGQSSEILGSAGPIHVPLRVDLYNNTIDLKALRTCVGNVSLENLAIFYTIDDQFYLGFNDSARINDTDKWAECLDSQGVSSEIWLAADMLGLGDAEQMHHLRSDNTINWISKRLTVIYDATNTKRAVTGQGVEYGVFRNKGCQYGDQANDGNYYPAGCKTVSSNSLKSGSGVNYLGRRVEFGIYPHHDCRSGGLTRKLNAGQATGCLNRDLFAVKGSYL